MRFARLAALLSGIVLAGCGYETGTAMPGTSPGSAAPPLEREAAAMTQAQPGTSTGVTQVLPGGNQGSRRTSAQRSPAAARGNLEEPGVMRPYDPRIGSNSRS